jgi:hypothetical protein
MVTAGPAVDTATVARKQSRGSQMSDTTNDLISFAGLSITIVLSLLFLFQQVAMYHLVSF